jgi:hypothetical protein
MRRVGQLTTTSKTKDQAKAERSIVEGRERESHNGLSLLHFFLVVASFFLLEVYSRCMTLELTTDTDSEDQNAGL